MNYEIDSLDRSILRALVEDARKPFLEIARELGVSGGTIHQRVNRLRELGVIRGSKAVLDYGRLGFGVSAFVGITLAKAGLSAQAQERLRAIPEIVEVHYTTGTYSLLAKIQTRGIPDLYALLSERLQSITEIQSTETFVILQTSVDRDPVLERRPPATPPPVKSGPVPPSARKAASASGSAASRARAR